MSRQACSAMLGLALAALIRNPAGAQQPPATFRLQVTDSSGAPIASATAVVSQNGSAVLIGRTDSSGRWTFSFSPDSGRYTLAIRHVGYRPATMEVPPVGNAVSLVVKMGRVPTTLDTLVVEDSLPKSKRPFIDAAEIGVSKRAMYNLNDLLRKLRPDMFYQRYKCVAATRLYVNGR